MADLQQVDPNISNKIKGWCFQKAEKCQYTLQNIEIISVQKNNKK